LGFIGAFVAAMMCGISAFDEGAKRMTRLNVGQHVKILPVVPTPFVGLEGIIREIVPHDRNITILDRYVVIFSWGEMQSFFDAQLSPL
jgi:hypothetical protein